MPKIVNRLDQLLAGLVGRVRFAGKDQLHRTVWIVNQSGETIQIPSEQVGAFIRGKAPGKTNGQRAGIEHIARRLDHRFVFAASTTLSTHTATDEFQQ